MTQPALPASAEPAPQTPPVPMVHGSDGATTVARLGAWAAAIPVADIQPGLRERALLQHLSAAGALRRVRRWDVLDALPEDLPGARAGRVDWLELSDHMLGAEGLVAGVVACWELCTADTTAAELVRATVAANEVAARVGLGAALHADSATARARTATVAAAVAGAVVMGLDGAGVSRALALALSMAPVADPAQLGGHTVARARVLTEACRQGMEAAALAQGGASGPLGALDGAGSRQLPLLRAAFTGLGTSWLSETLCFALEPVTPALAVPVQALQEVLRRHVKAADKRLRVDQVEGIEINACREVVDRARAVRAGAAGPQSAAVPWHLGWSLGLRVATHESGVAPLEPAALAAQRARIEAVAQTVHIRHDPARTAAVGAHRMEVLAPLLAGLERRELRSLFRRIREDDGSLPLRGALQFLRLHPERLIARMHRAEPDLDAVPLGAWRARGDTELIVHTTRGGHWPERREVSEGSPGWPWADTVARVRARFVGEDPQLSARGDAVLGARDSDSALALRTALLD